MVQAFRRCPRFFQLVILSNHGFLGEYAGFDENQPTAESGGKGKVISLLKEQYGFKTVVMIGDGATDLEASPPAVSVQCLTQHHPHFSFPYPLLVI